MFGLGVFQKGIWSEKTKKETHTSQVIQMDMPCLQVLRCVKQLTFFEVVNNPSFFFFFVVLFTPHLLWLDNKSSDRDCECTGCKSRPSARSVPLALSDTINECTIDSFKQVSSVTIGPSQGFYPELYTIPLPKIIKPDVALLSVKQERLLQAPVEQ